MALFNWPDPSSYHFSPRRSRYENNPSSIALWKTRFVSTGLLSIILLLGSFLSGSVAQAQSMDDEVFATAPVNINGATAAELAAGLNGVGLSKAEAIVRYREQFGDFESVEELTDVTGIGTATVERNRSVIILRE
ncbi:MAG: helix-hairpin-helix domain-containing protein [Pseudomonadota bacterium]